MKMMEEMKMVIILTMVIQCHCYSYKVVEDESNNGWNGR